MFTYGKKPGAAKTSEAKAKGSRSGTSRDAVDWHSDRPTAIADVEKVLASPGEALDPDTRASMENKFATDFRHVRFHTGANANAAAEGVNARAFVVGHQLVFARGEYAPSTQRGRSLLAHELAHTVQQRGQALGRPIPVSPTGTVEERRADSAAAAISVGRSPGHLGRSPAVIARQPKGADAATGDGPPVDTMAGAKVSQIIVSLARGRVGFQTSRGFIFGTVDTDLKPGSFELKPDIAKQKWIITSPEVKTGLRFNVDLEGALPWTLSYPEKLTLTVAPGLLTEPKTWAEATDAQGKPLDPLYLYEGAPQPLATEPPKGIDDFDAVYYDIDYKSEKGNLSKWLVARYGDESRRDISLDSVTETTPRLWAAKKEALKVMDDYNTLFILGAFPAVFFIITINPFVAPMAGRQTSYTTSRRSFPKAAGSQPLDDVALGKGQPPEPQPGAAQQVSPPAPAQDTAPTPAQDTAPTPAKQTQSAPTQESTPTPSKEAAPPPIQDYVNKNPKATADEVQIGKMLNKQAQEGKLGDTTRVEGAAEVKGARSGDYRFIKPDGTPVSADLYQPQSGNPDSISLNVIEKSGQAKTVVLELGAGKSGSITNEQASKLAADVLGTPGHSIERIIIIRDGAIIVNASR